MTDTDLLIQNLRRENEALRAELEWKQKEIELARRHEMQWISVKDKLPESDHGVLVAVSGRVGNITLIDAIEIGSFDRDEGWILEMWPDWEGPTITHWMPLPEPPKEANDGD